MSFNYVNYSKSLMQHQHHHDELETNYLRSLMQFQNNLNELETNYSRSLMQLQNNLSELKSNYSMRLQNELLANYSRSLIQLRNIVGELQSNNSRLSIRLRNLVDHNLELQINSSRSLDSKINTLHMIGQNPSNPVASCCHVLLLNLSSTSGHYWIKSSSGTAVRVYCDRQYADNCYNNGLIPSNLGLNEDSTASSCLQTALLVTIGFVHKDLVPKCTVILDIATLYVVSQLSIHMYVAHNVVMEGVNW